MAPGKHAAAKLGKKGSVGGKHVSSSPIGLPFSQKNRAVLCPGNRLW
jgi:hypothetical protein